MGKAVNMIIGLVCALVGAFLLLRWKLHFIRALQATVPALLLLGGGITVLAGLSELRDMAKEKKGPQK